MNPYIMCTTKIKTLKKLWESLDWKYESENDEAKKSFVDRFLDYKIVNSRTMLRLVEEV